MENVTISMGSVTWARRAEATLDSAGIRVRLRKLRPGESPRGCAWGIELPEGELGAAKDTLVRAGIPFSAIWRNTK